MKFVLKLQRKNNVLRKNGKGTFYQLRIKEMSHFALIHLFVVCRNMKKVRFAAN